MDVLLLGANGLLGLGAAVLAGAWARARPGGGRQVAALLAAVLAWAAVAVALGRSLPVEAFQPLREGFSTDHLRMAAGLDEDVGRLPEAVWRAWHCLGGRSLREAVTVGLLAGGWTAIGVGALALALVPDRRLAVLTAVGFATAPAWLVASTGPLHAPIAGVYVVFAAGLLALCEDDTLPRWTRPLAGAGALVVAALLPTLRPELAALSAGIAAAVVLRPLSPRVEAALARLGPPTPGRALGIVALVGLWLLACSAASPQPPPPSWGELQWVLAGLDPRSPHGLTLPLVLLGVAPAGLVLLALLGAATSLARPIRTALLPVVVWTMYVALRAAAHGRVGLDGPGRVSPYELYRYVLVLMPLVGLLAVLGARAASAASPAARVVVGLTCLLPAIPGVTRLLDVDGGPGAAWPARFGFDRDPQAEVRGLVRRLEAAPGCGLITLGHAWGGPPGPARFGWAALVPRPDGAYDFRSSDLPADTDAATAARALLGDVPCAAAWRALDCAEVHGPGCAPLDGLPTIAVRAVEHRPFVHPVHGGAWRPPLAIGLVAIPGYDPGP